MDVLASKISYISCFFFHGESCDAGGGGIKEESQRVETVQLGGKPTGVEEGLLERGPQCRENRQKEPRTVCFARGEFMGHLFITSTSREPARVSCVEFLMNFLIRRLEKRRPSSPSVRCASETESALMAIQTCLLH
ncbi:hypothetical protein LSTR_LSTR009333 [Laodelphax striatellus]|uniref:Uncharacterized protein n=1 Tax=Laodelphax striatellus TaxID=195883 RepID=A0A482XI60_LAOST|nr:hypothetical protein LSTR_LSTR009333 [Laodelphax striatellus]